MIHVSCPQSPTGRCQLTVPCQVPCGSRDSTLAALIEKAKAHKMTPHEEYQQRVSWLFGELGLQGYDYSREQVQGLLEKHGYFDPATLSHGAPK